MLILYTLKEYNIATKYIHRINICEWCKKKQAHCTMNIQLCNTISENIK